MMKAWYEKSINALQLNGKGERTQEAYTRAVTGIPFDSSMPNARNSCPRCLAAKKSGGF